jgi:hypothetical protein
VRARDKDRRTRNAIGYPVRTWSLERIITDPVTRIDEITLTTTAQTAGDPDADANRQALLWSGKVARLVLAAQGRPYSIIELNEMRRRLFPDGPQMWPRLRGLQHGWLIHQLRDAGHGRAYQIRCAYQPDATPDELSKIVADYQAGNRYAGEGLYEQKRKQLARDLKALQALQERIREEGVEIDWTSSPPRFVAINEGGT